MSVVRERNPSPERLSLAAKSEIVFPHAIDQRIAPECVSTGTKIVLLIMYNYISERGV